MLVCELFSSDEHEMALLLGPVTPLEQRHSNTAFCNCEGGGHGVVGFKRESVCPWKAHTSTRTLMPTSQKICRSNILLSTSWRQ